MESGVDTTFNDAYIALFEDGDESTGFIDKISDAISNIIEKIQKLFHDAKCAITKHFQDNEVEKKAKEVDEATKGITKKVSYKSRKEAIDLSKVTLEDVYKAKDFNEVEALMTKYRKQRNKAIAIGTIITLSVAGIGAFVIKKKNDLNNELERQKSVAEKVVETKTQLVGTAASVFFNINSAKVASRKDLVAVKELAEYAKANNAKIVVTGYADSKTGSAAYNQALSQKRADTVAAELVKMGVNRDNIVTEAKGGVNNLSPFSYNRRATVKVQ